MAAERDCLGCQKELTGYFQLWRDGKRQQWAADPAHKEEARKMQFPRPGHWKGHSQHGASKSIRYRITKASNSKGPTEKAVMATTAAKGLEQALKVADLRFEKVLGWGGLGIACLFEGTKSSGDTFKIVCKANLRQENSYILERERRSHVSMAGAKHIVQRVLLQGPAKHNLYPYRAPIQTAMTFDGILGTMSLNPGQRTIAERDEAAEEEMEATKRHLDADQNLLFIEFMRRGNLDTYLEKLGARRVRFPDAVLWQMFQCLFKACVAMAYPRKYQPLGSYPENQNIPQVSETYDGIHRPNSSDPVLVHFDLDTLNILVGEFDDDEHNLVPLIKVADLGLARLIGVEQRNDKWVPWTLRRSGKAHTLSPEQFTEEWDYVPGSPFQSGEETAGNYHWWTNLYQVGLAMWSLITICRPECPPEARQYTRKAEDGTEIVGWTYGEWLLDPIFNTVDRELRELVVRCMDHTPASRPTMETLFATFNRRARAKASTANDQQVQKISRKIFGDPPPPPAPTPSFGSVVFPALPRQPPGGPIVPALPRPPPINMPYAGTAGPRQNPYAFQPFPRTPPSPQAVPGPGPGTANPQLRNPSPFLFKELPPLPPVSRLPPSPLPTYAPVPQPANAPLSPFTNRPPPPFRHALPSFPLANPRSGRPPPNQESVSFEEVETIPPHRRGGGPPGPGPVRKRDQARKVIGDIFKRH